MYAPTLGLQRSAHARGAGKGIVGRAYLDPTPLQGSKNEWKEPGFVADVPHDAKKGEVVRLALAAMLNQYHGQTSAGVNTACVTPGMANPYVEFNAVAAALAIS